MRYWLVSFLLLFFSTVTYAQYPNYGPTIGSDPYSTNPPEIQKWFKSLQNRMGGPCCGEGDGYPAIIDREATPEHLGKGHIIDPSEKSVIVNGNVIKIRPRLIGDLTFEYSWERMTKEQFGNPLDTAIVFVRTSARGEGSVIAREFDDGIYCIALLPKYY